MNVYVILRWKWEVESTVESDFTIMGIFSDVEKAQFNLDKFQKEALIMETTGCFYWIEEHTMNKIKESTSK